MPASETVDFEREFAELVRELRAVPSEAPQELRERVRALDEPAPRREFKWPRVTRRSLLVLAPVCVVAVATAAVVYGLVSSSNPSTNQEAAGTVPTSTQPTSTQGQGGAVRSSQSPAKQHGVTTFKALTQQQPFALSDSVAGVPAPNPNRYQNYQASLRVRVKDFDALGKRTADAMQITRQLGGYVASVEQSTTSGALGEAGPVGGVPPAPVHRA